MNLLYKFTNIKKAIIRPSYYLILLIFLLGCKKEVETFDAGSAWDFLEYQVTLGPRPVGSAAHGKTVEWIFETLNWCDVETENQDSSKLGHPIGNIVARRGEGEQWII